MLALVIIPQLCREEHELRALLNTHANPAHYEYTIEEDAFVIGPDGVIARLVTESLGEQLVSDTAAALGTVHGDGHARGSIAGAGSMMPRFRKDGTLARTTEIPRSIVKKMRERNEFTDFLGWMDKSKTGDRFPTCRQTAWSLDNPEVHAAAEPFVREVSRVYREELPEHWQRQQEFMRSVSHRFAGSEYSTVTVNRNKRTTYHYDTGDFRGGMGNLIVLRGNGSGELVLPRYRIAFRVRPTDVLLMNVHEMHGNLPITGERLTAVLYAREHIDDCDK